jgi:hypothetical protein
MRIRRAVLGAIAGIGLVGAALLGGTAAAAGPASPAPDVDPLVAESSVPPVLVPPPGNSLVAAFGAAGVQIYRCTGTEWVFVEPAASLVGTAKGSKGPQTVIHFRGPSWQSSVDGSLVEGAVVASSPVPGSIAELLVQSTRNQGDGGIFSRVSFVQRLATSGGVAPAPGPCATGTITGVPYLAVYRFFAPA